VVDEAPGGGMAGPVRRSIWPAMHPRLLDLIEHHQSTIVFVNARRLAERLAARLNELALGGENRGAEAVGHAGVDAARADDDLYGGEVEQPTIVRAHHGSLSRERRVIVEDQLKRGQ